MSDLDNDMLVDMTGANTVEEVTNILAAAEQAVLGALAICQWFDCWDPASLPGDKRFSVNTAIDHYIGMMAYMGWYSGIARINEQGANEFTNGRVNATRISRTAQAAWNAQFERSRDLFNLPGMVGQRRTPENHSYNLTIAGKATENIMNALEVVMNKEDEPSVIFITTPRFVVGSRA